MTQGCPWCGKWMTAYMLVIVISLIAFAIFYVSNMTSIDNYEKTVMKCNDQAMACGELQVKYNTLAENMDRVHLNLTYIFNMTGGNDVET